MNVSFVEKGHKIENCYKRKNKEKKKEKAEKAVKEEDDLVLCSITLEN